MEPAAHIDECGVRGLAAQQSKPTDVGTCATYGVSFAYHLHGLGTLTTRNLGIHGLGTLA